MKKLIFALLCLVMATATYSNACVMVNVGDHFELNGSCTEKERDIMIDAFARSCRGDSCKLTINNKIEDKKHEKKPTQHIKPAFYKTLDGDTHIRANEIEGWTIKASYNERKDISLANCEGGRLYKQWTYCGRGCPIDKPDCGGFWCNYVCAERKWLVMAKYEGLWHDIKVFKTRQQAKDWLDRQAP